jgi:hypothetical protein
LVCSDNLASTCRVLASMKNKLHGLLWVSFLMCAISICTLIAFAQPPGPPPQGGFGPRAGGPGGRGPGGPGGPGGGPGVPGFGRGPGGGIPREVVTGAPYSGVETHDSSQTLADGSKITHSDSTKVFRDSQGRVRTENTITPPPGSTEQARTMITIFDPVAGTISRIDPQAMTVDKSTIPVGDGGRRPPPAPPAGTAGPNVVTVDLGSKTINGLIATGTRTTVTIAAGTVGNSGPLTNVHEIWVSTDLKVPVLITDSDSRTGTRTTQLTGVSRAEPSASLFVAPSTYTVTSHTRPAGPPR